MTRLTQPSRVPVSTTETQLVIPRGARVVQLIPQSAVAYQIASARGESNVGGKYAGVPAGTILTWDLDGTDEFAVYLYAASTVNLDVLVFV